MRPRHLASPAWRDATGIAFLAALAFLLLLPWVSGERYLADVAGQMASFYLLPAMGFMLALRRGAIDLSVWVAAGMGGMVAAGAISAGQPPAMAFAEAFVAGLALGSLNGALVTLARIPSVLATAGTALAVMYCLQSQTGGARQIAVPEYAFEGWMFMPGIPLPVLRMLLIAMAYSAVMLGLVWFDGARRGPFAPSSTWTLAGSLAVSGAISAFAGACWLIDYGAAPVPTRLVEDLRVPAAAVLAGALYFGGRGRTMLAGVCLPPALLLATAWRQQVWLLPFHGYDFQMILLTGMVIVTHIGLTEAAAVRSAGRQAALAAAALTSLGTLTLAATAALSVGASRKMHAAGLAMWLAGATMVIVSRALQRRATRRYR